MQERSRFVPKMGRRRALPNMKVSKRFDVLARSPKFFRSSCYIRALRNILFAIAPLNFDSSFFDSCSLEPLLRCSLWCQPGAPLRKENRALLRPMLLKPVICRSLSSSKFCVREIVRTILVRSFD